MALAASRVPMDLLLFGFARRSGRGGPFSKRLFGDVNAVRDHDRRIDNELRHRCQLRHQRLPPQQAQESKRHLPAALPPFLCPCAGSPCRCSPPPAAVRERKPVQTTPNAPALAGLDGAYRVSKSDSNPNSQLRPDIKAVTSNRLGCTTRIVPMKKTTRT